MTRPRQSRIRFAADPCVRPSILGGWGCAGWTGHSPATVDPSWGRHADLLVDSRLLVRLKGRSEGGVHRAASPGSEAGHATWWVPGASREQPGRVRVAQVVNPYLEVDP